MLPSSEKQHLKILASAEDSWQTEVVDSYFLYFLNQIELHSNAKRKNWRSTGGTEETNEELVACTHSRDMHCQLCTPSSAILAAFCAYNVRPTHSPYSPCGHQLSACLIFQSASVRRKYVRVVLLVSYGKLRGSRMMDTSWKYRSGNKKVLLKERRNRSRPKIVSIFFFSDSHSLVSTLFPGEIAPTTQP